MLCSILTTAVLLVINYLAAFSGMIVCLDLQDGHEV
jgi:hypothetical protein